MDVPQSILEQVRSFLSARFSEEISIYRTKPLSGGCIHQAYVLDTTAGSFFLKWNKAEEASNFQAESKGLQLLERHSSDFTVTPLTTATAGNFSYILLEFIDQQARARDFWEDFGRKLALLHRNTSPVFGLDHNNYIGNLPQSNRRHPDFTSFFIEERLKPQLKLALSKHLIDLALRQEFERLYPRLPSLIPFEQPALLHGDLWSGNFLCGKAGHVRTIDPAVYYGHREAEIAFTLLFGGFDRRFYEVYREYFPLQSGWRNRTELFNLYPLLVHLNLFGSSYLNGIKRILRSYT